MSADGLVTGNRHGCESFALDEDKIMPVPENLVECRLSRYIDLAFSFHSSTVFSFFFFFLTLIECIAGCMDHFELN